MFHGIECKSLLTAYSNHIIYSYKRLGTNSIIIISRVVPVAGR